MTRCALNRNLLKRYMICSLKSYKFEVSVVVKHNESVVSIALRCIQNLLRNFKRRKKNPAPYKSKCPLIVYFKWCSGNIPEKVSFLGSDSAFSEDIMV